MYQGCVGQHNTIQKTLLQWIKQWDNDRWSAEGERMLHNGVPQGSVLGTVFLLFKVFHLATSSNTEDFVPAALPTAFNTDLFQQQNQWLISVEIKLKKTHQFHHSLLFVIKPFL